MSCRVSKLNVCYLVDETKTPIKLNFDVDISNDELIYNLYRFNELEYTQEITENINIPNLKEGVYFHELIWSRDGIDRVVFQGNVEIRKKGSEKCNCENSEEKDVVINVDEYTINVELNGGSGGYGVDGIGLNYEWRGTELGIKREDETDFEFVDLKGDKGDKGSSGSGTGGVDLTYILGKNIYSSEMNIAGKYINSTYALANSVNSIYAKIPISKGTYTLSRNGNITSYNSFNSFYITDNNDVKILTDKLQLLPFDRSGKGRVINAPEGSAFLYINIYSDVSTGMPNMSSSMQIEQSDLVTEYSPYKELVTKIDGYELTDEEANKRIDNYDSRRSFKGKTLAVLGDSISAGSNGKKWVDVLTSKYLFDNIYNVARSGARWSHQAVTTYDISLNGVGSNVMWNQANLIISKVRDNSYKQPDVILIKCGRNDANITLGTASSVFDNNDILSREPNTILTVAEGIRYTCETLLNEYPDVQIILITPIQWALTSGNTWLSIGDLIKESAMYLSVDVIDAGGKSGIYNFLEKTPKYLLDGTHPNELGNEKLGNFILNELRTKVIQ